jgi:multidrug efflux system outer membrane protein
VAARSRRLRLRSHGAVQLPILDPERVRSVDNSLVAARSSSSSRRAGRLAALNSYAQLATLQFNGGYTSYTTCCRPAIAFPAQLQLASLRASVFSSSVNIYKAMGGGWVVAADRMTGDQAPPPADRDTGLPPLF